MSRSRSPEQPRISGAQTGRRQGRALTAAGALGVGVAIALTACEPPATGGTAPAPQATSTTFAPEAGGALQYGDYSLQSDGRTSSVYIDNEGPARLLLQGGNESGTTLGHNKIARIACRVLDAAGVDRVGIYAPTGNIYTTAQPTPDSQESLPDILALRLDSKAYDDINKAAAAAKVCPAGV